MMLPTWHLNTDTKGYFIIMCRCGMRPGSHNTTSQHPCGYKNKNRWLFQTGFKLRSSVLFFVDPTTNSDPQTSVFASKYYMNLSCLAARRCPVSFCHFLLLLQMIYLVVLYRGSVSSFQNALRTQPMPRKCTCWLDFESQAPWSSIRLCCIQRVVATMGIAGHVTSWHSCVCWRELNIDINGHTLGHEAWWMFPHSSSEQLSSNELWCHLGTKHLF